MRSLTIAGILLAVSSGCGWNGCFGGVAMAPEPRSGNAPERGLEASDRAADGGSTGEAGVTQQLADASPVTRMTSPISLAQRFVVGWASGGIASLEQLCDGEAASLLRRALAGETVDTPLGRLTPDRQRARSFSFTDRRASQVEGGLHRVSFSLSLRLEEGDPIETRHIVLVRGSDSKVVSWNAPSPPDDGGV